MPELPEVETIARDLGAAIEGKRIDACRVHRPDVLRHIQPRTFERRQLGCQVVRVFRRAKTAVVQLSGEQYLLVAPKFTGRLLVDQDPDEYVVIRWGFADGSTLLYRDVRRLGTVQLLDGVAYARFDGDLGIEPLTPDFTPEAFSGILRSSRAAIKKVLMDQKRLAGVGNIYANEALWLAGIDPSRPAMSLDQVESMRLREEVVGVLRAGIEARGTTFSDYRDARNEAGAFAGRLRVYGRGGMACMRCGTRLTDTHALDGRTTVFCHRCQA